MEIEAIIPPFSQHQHLEAIIPPSVVLVQSVSHLYKVHHWHLCRYFYSNNCHILAETLGIAVLHLGDPAGEEAYNVAWCPQMTVICLQDKMTTGRHYNVNCCCMSPAAGETQLLIGITVRSAHHSFCKGLIMMTMIVIINRPYQLLLIV
ncbi:uncharacterized protein [Dysidea avara]|uniref:uncharacterized protein isoform X2 n=1 Tax=Dysidea avara TaxID=196820 RepID=UPI00332A13E2